MGKIILITHQKGRVGKSTLTFNLAQNLSENASVAILDLDLQGSLSSIKDLVTDFEIIPYKGEIKKIQNLDYDFIFIIVDLLCLTSFIYIQKLLDSKTHFKSSIDGINSLVLLFFLMKNELS